MKKFISPSNDQLSYMGRISFTNPERPEFYYAGSNVRMRFKGTHISVIIKNYKQWGILSLGYVLDGKEDKVMIDENDKDITLTIADKLDDAEHEIILFKRLDSQHYFEFVGFEINENGEILDKKPELTRKIECFGDSVSAGEVCEAIDCVGSNDPENNEAAFDNSWHSYPLITARNLNAQIHDIAQGGIAIFDNTGYYHSPDFIGMESVYDKLAYMPETKGGITQWDFSLYTPNVVIFAVGQNDQHHEGFDDFDITDRDYRRKWKDGYKKIIFDLMEKYPKATFILTLTILCHDAEWDKAVDEIAEEINSDRVSHFMFTRSGKATPGHPRIPEQYEMAEELTAYISSMGDKVWEN